jgi:hypothetical protein
MKRTVTVSWNVITHIEVEVDITEEQYDGDEHHNLAEELRRSSDSDIINATLMTLFPDGKGSITDKHVKTTSSFIKVSEPWDEDDTPETYNTLNAWDAYTYGN